MYLKAPAHPMYICINVYKVSFDWKTRFSVVDCVFSNLVFSFLISHTRDSEPSKVIRGTNALWLFLVLLLPMLLKSCVVAGHSCMKWKWKSQPTEFLYSHHYLPMGDRWGGASQWPWPCCCFCWQPANCHAFRFMDF